MQSAQKNQTQESKISDFQNPSSPSYIYHEDFETGECKNVPGSVLLIGSNTLYAVRDNNGKVVRFKPGRSPKKLVQVRGKGNRIPISRGASNENLDVLVLDIWKNREKSKFWGRIYFPIIDDSFSTYAENQAFIAGAIHARRPILLVTDIRWYSPSEDSTTQLITFYGVGTLNELCWINSNNYMFIPDYFDPKGKIWCKPSLPHDNNKIQKYEADDKTSQEFQDECLYIYDDIIAKIDEVEQYKKTQQQIATPPKLNIEGDQKALEARYTVSCQQFDKILQTKQSTILSTNATSSSSSISSASTSASSSSSSAQSTSSTTSSTSLSQPQSQTSVNNSTPNTSANLSSPVNPSSKP